jgi:hypothetical protein
VRRCRARLDAARFCTTFIKESTSAITDAQSLAQQRKFAVLKGQNARRGVSVTVRRAPGACKGRLFWKTIDVSTFCKWELSHV